MNLVKLDRPFYKIHDNDIIIDKSITRDTIDNIDTSNTILDERLTNSCGYIKLKNNFILYNYFIARKKIKNILTKNVDPLFINKKCETYKTNNEYLRIPKGINKIFILENGLKILTGLQKAYNNIIIENDISRSNNRLDNIIYQNLYTKLLIEYNSLLCGKGALYDKSCNSVWPFSCRATVAPGPNLKINEACLPYQVLLRWVSKDEVRSAFNIDLNIPNKEAVRYLEGKYVMIGRQPTHDRSNLMGFKIKIGYNAS